MPQLPKLSYVLLSHNREKYIRAAIESAFAQDYEGELEYIFSDDCSTDRTFEIIKECVAAYKGGRRVVVTQTPTNQHLAGNTNHAVQFVESDWIVRADDDDISAVDRCTVIGKAIAEHPEASFVMTRREDFTDATADQAAVKASQKAGCVPKARVLDVRCATESAMSWFHMPLSLHQVWSAKHYKAFGNLPKDGYWVDDMISFWRCCVLGVGLDIDAVTSYIRNSSDNMSHGGQTDARGYRAIICLEQFYDRYSNVAYEPLRVTHQQLKEYVAEHFSEQEKEKAARFMEELERTMDKRSDMRTYWRKGTLHRIRIAHKHGYHKMFDMLRCLPMPLYAGILATIRKLKGKS